MNIRRPSGSAMLLLLLPAIASAHPGHTGSAITAGALHPFTGADHLAALLAVGAWSAIQQGRARLAIPAIFLGFLAAGGALAPAVAVPAGLVEQGIAASLLVIGLVLALRLRFAVPLTAALAAAFASFHGAAHGLEAPPPAIGFAAGVLVGSAALIAAGFGVASVLARRDSLSALRIGGALIAGGGGLLLLG